MVIAALFAPHPSDDDDSDWQDAWDRVKRAMRRDWHQTKYDMKLASGAELNQDYGDTLRQMIGSQCIPYGARPNRKKVAKSAGRQHFHAAGSVA